VAIPEDMGDRVKFLDLGGGGGRLNRWKGGMAPRDCLVERLEGEE
jgi:hypothetical protein